MASATSTPPTPPTSLPAFARITSASVLQRNASSSSSRSTTTSESSSSLVAVPIRPPPIQTRTAATPEAQPLSDSASGYASVDSEPGGIYGGRGFMRNGPRMARGATPVSTIATPHSLIIPNDRSPSLPPNLSMSPTTPKAHRMPLPREYPNQPTSPAPIRVTIAADDSVYPGGQPSPSNPTTPTHRKPRSVSDLDSARLESRERRHSQVSTHSNGSAASRRPSVVDFNMGEELGRGSYSTVRRRMLDSTDMQVVRATQNVNPRIPHDVAVKIMNQHHLIQEKKAKYAHIERDALIRLSLPRPALSPTLRSHRRGVSGSSANGVSATRGTSSGTSTARRDSGSSPPSGFVMASPSGGLRDRRLNPSDAPSPRAVPAPLSPLVSTSMRLAKSSDSQTQELLDEPANTPAFSSRPPSPVQEEVHDGSTEQGSSSETELLQPYPTRSASADLDIQKARTPRKRRQSNAPSVGSAKSAGGGHSHKVGHPGIIHLYCTFVDQTSVCEYRNMVP